MKRYLLSASLIVVALACSPTSAIPLALEQFDYPSGDSALDGKTGGFGWLSPWVSVSSPFSLSQDDVSLDSPVFPFPTAGDRAVSAAGTASIAVREFSGINMAEDGNVLYASLLMQKDGDPATGTGGNNVEFDLGVDGGTTIRFGSTSSHAFFLDAGSNSTGTVELGTTYMLVLKVSSNAAAPDLVEASFFGPSDTLPTTEPTTWALTDSLISNAMINTARFWIGSTAFGSVDELRLGRTWDDVTFFDPNFIQGDFDGMNGLDPNDYLILRNNMFTGTTYEQGDFDGNGTVDLRDFIDFREVWNAQGLGAFPGPVPEPSTWVLLALGGLLCGGYCRRHGRR